MMRNFITFVCITFSRKPVNILSSRASSIDLCGSLRRAAVTQKGGCVTHHLARILYTLPCEEKA